MTTQVTNSFENILLQRYNPNMYGVWVIYSPEGKELKQMRGYYADAIAYACEAVKGFISYGNCGFIKKGE